MYDSFGFSQNIFNTKPLRPTKDDAQYFVGRLINLNSFMVDISSEDRALAVVSGHRGVGKTSFVNIMEFACSQSEPLFDGLAYHESYLLPCFHKVQIEPSEQVGNLLFKCISSIMYSIRGYSSATGIPFPVELEPLLQWVSEIVPTTSTSLGGSVAGLGVSGSSTKEFRPPDQIPATTYCEQIRTIIKTVKKHFDLKGIFLNLNNLEIIDETEFTSLMDQMRDYLFEIEGLWTILIGYPGIYSTLATKSSRVAEIVSGQETYLAPLSEDEVIEVLNIRRRLYAINNISTPPLLPIDEQLIRDIYQNSDGEIRAVLKACDDIVRAIFKENPTVTRIGRGIGLSFLKNIMANQLALDTLKPKEKDILNNILSEGPIRPKEYQRLSLKSSVEFTNRARPLLKANYLNKTIEGNAAIYDVSGVVRLANFSGVIIEDD